VTEEVLPDGFPRVLPFERRIALSTLNFRQAQFDGAWPDDIETNRSKALNLAVISCGQRWLLTGPIFAVGCGFLSFHSNAIVDSFAALFLAIGVMGITMVIVRMRQSRRFYPEVVVPPGAKRSRLFGS
jgi:hypothetical protein